MAPGYRNRDRERDRRQNRTGYVDHDIFEGLPVRHWRRDYVTVAPSLAQENNAMQNDVWAVELPHGMPKDSHLLSQHSQDLLRAVRSGKIYKRPPPVEEEETDPEILLGDKPEKKEDDHRDKGFMAKAWKQIPRHLEGPDIEYLAKRRKGLVSIVSKTKGSAPTLTKATVKRIDAAGNEYVQDIVISHGQKVQGEIISQVEVPDPSASALSNDPFAVPTPRKKGPIIRKKSKPVGKSKKKKPAAPTSVPQNIELNGTAQAVAALSDQTTSDVQLVESGNGVVSASNEDTEMAEGSNVASDEEECEEGDEGENGDGNDEGETPLDNQHTPGPGDSAPPMTPVKREVSDFTSSELDGSSIHLPGPWRSDLERDDSDMKSGSPLKNLVSTDPDLTPLESPTATAAHSLVPTTSALYDGHADRTETVVQEINSNMEQATAEVAPTELLSASPHPTDAEVDASLELRLEEEEEEEMLLDIVENTNGGLVDGNHVLETQSAWNSGRILEAEDSSLAGAALSEEQTSEKLTIVADQFDEADGKVDEEADDDDFLDLLGSLEKQLNRHAGVAPSTSG